MQSKVPLITVVIPCHNSADYIVCTLDSVAGQQWSDYEIIVVDDGSHDNTADVVRGWIRNHPGTAATLICQANAYQGAARNRGIHAARGEYIAFLDADDLWYEQKLGRCVEVLRCDPAIDLVCHDELLIRPGRPRRRITAGPWVNYRDLLFRGNCLSPSATIVRRACLLAINGHDERAEYFGVEDYDCWLRLVRACARIAYLNEPLGMYCMHGGNMTVAKARRYRENQHFLLQEHIAALGELTPFDRYRANIVMAKCRLHIALEVTRGGEYADGWRRWFRILWQSPIYHWTWLWPALLGKVILQREAARLKGETGYK
jgi:glycosyltransferase involved in cell wall biosynthesis